MKDKACIGFPSHIPLRDIVNMLRSQGCELKVVGWKLTVINVVE